MPGREESTFLLDCANLHGENVASSDECWSPTSGEGSTDDCISRSGVMTATMEELPLTRLELCVASEDSALDVASLDGENVASSDESSSESSVEGSTDDYISTPDVMTATMKEPPLERLEICVASEDSREVKHQVTFLKRCVLALVISGAVIGIWLISMSRSSVTRVTPQRAENSCDDDAPLLCSAPVVDGDTDHAVMAAFCNSAPATSPTSASVRKISMLTGVESAGCHAQGGERNAVVIPLVDGRISKSPEAQGNVAHAISLPCDQEAVDDTGLDLARAVFENCPDMLRVAHHLMSLRSPWSHLVQAHL